ncbi:MAG: hypothetical protein NZM18_13530 [Thermoflexales bacterium]|nr:hypothetical protein [Thermoflexales bacterium]
MDGNEQNNTTPASFEDWLAQQDEQVRALYDEHVKGLRSALESERQRA